MTSDQRERILRKLDALKHDDLEAMEAARARGDQSEVDKSGGRAAGLSMAVAVVCKETEHDQ